MKPARTRSLAVAILVGALVLAACGDDDSSAPPEDTAATGGMNDEMDGHEDDEHTSFAFGEPADDADADRTVEIEALDQLAYEPSEVEVEAGEIVTFVVTNTGEAVHEFVIGDHATQEDHEAEMAEMMESGMEMHDDVNALSLAAGETKRITWRFTQAGSLEFACHEPGHYAGGMVGTLTVT